MTGLNSPYILEVRPRPGTRNVRDEFGHLLSVWLSRYSFVREQCMRQ
jgi:hypothetical protein